MRLAHTGPAWKNRSKDKDIKKGEKGGERELYARSKKRGNLVFSADHFPAKGAGSVTLPTSHLQEHRCLVIGTYNT